MFHKKFFLETGALVFRAIRPQCVFFVTRFLSSCSGSVFVRVPTGEYGNEGDPLELVLGYDLTAREGERNKSDKKARDIGGPEHIREDFPPNINKL